MKNNNEGLAKVIQTERRVKQHQSVIDCYNTMIQTADHGASWKSEQLAEILQCKLNSRVFGLRLAAVNRMLEMEKGFHLTSKGKNGLEYFIEDIKVSITTVKKMQNDAIDQLKRAGIYAGAVVREHGEKLSQMERYKLEKQREIAAKRLLFSISVK